MNDTPLRETESNSRNLGKDTDAVNCVDVGYHIAIHIFVFQEESIEVGLATLHQSFNGVDDLRPTAL